MHTEFLHPRYEKLEPTVKQRIFDAALREFGRFGFSAASVNRVVEGAGISKGALFKYFGTKSGLFSYIYSATLHEVKGILRRVRDDTRDEPFFTRLEKVIAAGLRFTSEHPFSAAVYYRVIFTGDAPEGNVFLARVQDTSRRFLATLVSDGIAAGELRDDLDPERSAFILQSVLDRFLQTHYLHFMAPALELGDNEAPDPRSLPDTWTEEIISIFRYGMTKE